MSQSMQRPLWKYDASRLKLHEDDRQYGIYYSWQPKSLGGYGQDNYNNKVTRTK